MFRQWKQSIWDDGSAWGIDTFAFIVEMNMLMGESLEQAYENTKKTMVRDKKLQSRLDAWRSFNVQS